MKKLTFIFIGVAIGFCSCKKPDTTPIQNSGEVIFGPLKFELGSMQKILDGYIVKAIAFDSKGNAWIGTFNQGVIRYNAQETVIFNSDNSIIPKDFVIWDIAVDKNDNVWVGGTEGLLKYDGKKFTLYNSRNTAMPEDVVWNIAVDSKNNIWLASCRFRQGGLAKYDGAEWTAYTPGNSALPTNSVKSIAIDRSDNVWLALSDEINEAYLVKISNNKWNVYAEKELGFKPFYFGDIEFNSKNCLVGAIDHSIGGSLVTPPPHFFTFDGKTTTLLSCDDAYIHISKPKITIDHNNYVWHYGVNSDCGVWVGERWKKFDRSEFGGSSVWALKEDARKRIWFGTEDGIYIR